MSENFGPGLMGGVVLVDPISGQPYKAADFSVADLTNPATPAGASLSSTYDTVVGLGEGTGSDDTAALNALLATAGSGKVAKGKRGQTYRISAPLVLKSGSTLDMSGCTVVLLAGSNCNMVRNENSASVVGRDSDLTIIGGTWQRGANGGVGSALHTIFLRHIDGLTVRDIAVTSAAGKYAVAVGDVTRYHIENLRFDTFSDGVHVTGPARSGFIGSIHGTTGDDMVAFTARDYATYDDVRGDIVDTVVQGVYPNGSLCALKVISGTGTKVRRLRAQGLYGTCTSGGVKLFDDSTGPSDLGSIHVSDVEIHCGTGIAMVLINCSLGKDLKLSNLSMDGTGYADAKMVSIDPSYLGSSVIKDIEIRGLTMRGNPTSADGVRVNGAVTIDSLTIDGVSALETPTSFWACRLLSSTTYVKSLTLRSVRVVRNGGNLVEVSTVGGRVDRAIVSDVYITGGGAIWQNAVGSTLAALLYLSNIDHAASVLVTAGGPVTVQMSNIKTTASTALVRAQGVTATPIRVIGRGLNGSTGGVTRDGSQVVTVCHPEAKSDLSILAKTDGDEAYNTNVSLACGAGRAICNGTNWKNVYSGLTY